MLIRLLLWVIVGFLVYTVFQFIKQALLKPPGPPANDRRRGEEMVLDPECGTYIPRNEAIKEERQGKINYFCSPECRDRNKSKNKD